MAENGDRDRGRPPTARRPPHHPFGGPAFGREEQPFPLTCASKPYIVTVDGGYVGTLMGQEMPEAFGPGGLVAWVERDDLGVERVVLRRLPAEWRP